MKIILSFFLSFFLLTIFLFGQSSERPETIVIPVSSLGKVSEVRKQILQNTLEDELKSHFRLISQERYEEVLEKVFEDVDYEECLNNASKITPVPDGVGPMTIACLLLNTLLTSYVQFGESPVELSSFLE